MIAKAGFTGRAKFEALTAAEMRERPGSMQLFVVTAPLVFASVRWARELVVPAGTETDFASIPAWAKAWLDDDDPRILSPSILHDRRYSVRGRGEPGETPMTRLEVDELLVEAMLSCFASPFVAGVVFRAVRIGGASHWPSLSSDV